MNHQVLPAIQLLEKDFALQQLELPPAITEVDSLTELKEELCRLMNHLLDNDFEKLCNLMYRVDVSEEAFREAMIINSNHNIAERLAELVLERELQKVELRKRFSRTTAVSI